MSGATTAGMKPYVDRLVALWKRQIELTEVISEAEQGIVEELGLQTSKTYVMQAGQRGLVKIGRATDIEARRKALQTGCPVPLKVLRVIHFDCEREMHARFAHVWKMGEWFEFDLDMLIETFNADLLEMARVAMAPEVT